ALRFRLMGNLIILSTMTDSPYFYISLTTMLLGTQLFVAGFLGDLISRNSQERNKYQVEDEI
ncbi:MAG: glycosyltransferase, partial [Bacteroidaceae bacterium]|nr:glycosyltransferase [Bacteroidaceae bacterium]